MATGTARKSIPARGETIPDFTLNRIDGEPFSSRSLYMRRNLVIALLPEGTTDVVREWVTAAFDSITAMVYEDVAFIVITPNRESARDVVGIEETGTGRLIVLVDDEVRAATRFGHDRSMLGLVITDRYGTVFHSAQGTPDANELDPTEIPEWVELVVCRCS
jgi:hypothetical protein